MTPVTAIRGIGPAQERLLAAAGIDSAETLRRIGADEAYLRMLSVGARPHFIAYYALHMALQGRPWNDLKGAEKDEMRKAYDALLRRRPKSAGLPPPDLAAFMDRIGLRPPRRHG
ncbi:TfoX/Sxy family protein [Roseivivax isoporae]|uniref:TfoX/Sxy family protein n=1 Tax=Roseivivax isoporae TaxID=591206 RepID=UPI0004ADEEC6